MLIQVYSVQYVCKCQVRIPFNCAGCFLFLSSVVSKFGVHTAHEVIPNLKHFVMNMPSWGKFRGREVMLAMMNLELALERATRYDLVRQKELIEGYLKLGNWLQVINSLIYG